MEVNKDWKEKNQKYINAMQICLDKVSNIQNGDLKEEVIDSIIYLDRVITELATNEINMYKNIEEKK